MPFVAAEEIGQGHARDAGIGADIAAFGGPGEAAEFADEIGDGAAWLATLSGKRDISRDQVF